MAIPCLPILIEEEVTVFEEEASAPHADFIRVWCVLHQIALPVKDAYKSIGEGAWLLSTIRKIAHLRRQVNWIIRIGSKCPYLALTRWLSMGSFCDWVYDYRLQIIQQYLESPHESEPDDRWWLTTTAVKVITSPINHYDSLIHFHLLPQWSPIFQLLNM